MPRKSVKKSRRNIWTPNENDFCRCGGIFFRSMGECSTCGAPKTPDNRYEPGPHDYTPDVETKKEATA